MKPTPKPLTVLWLAAMGLATGQLGCDAPEREPTNAATGGLISAGGMASTTIAAPDPTGDSAGGGHEKNVNVHDCSIDYPSAPPYPTTICFRCDPLPAGSTRGCGVPTRCGDTDTSSPTHYPIGCNIVFPWQNTTYYPEELEAAVCGLGADGLPYWQCLL
jgi:hypothetical protein